MRKAVPCALSILLLIVPVARAQKRHPSLVVEDAYREALAELAAGSPVQAVNRVTVLETESSTECLRAIELRTAEEFAEREPESIVGQAYLRLGVRQVRYRTRGESRRLFSFEYFSIRGLQELAELYVASSQQSDAPSVAAGLLTYMAHGVGSLRSPARLGVAREILEAALVFDSNHVAALHSLAVTLELRGHLGQSLRSLDRLVMLEPEEARFRMRRAVVTLKAGQLERARVLLEELTADDSIWARDLATQELARLLLAKGRGDEAIALLRNALPELPREKLSLQLAAQLDPRWRDSGEVLGTLLAGPEGDSGPSARWIYEAGAKEEIDALRRELGAGVSERSLRLENSLSLLPDPADRHRKILAGCR